LNERTEKKLTASNDINLYTAMAIFVDVADRLIDGIFDAAEAEDFPLVEKLAVSLNVYSSSAKLAVFSENAKKLIIAAKQRDLSAVKNEAEKLKCSFGQMIKSADTSVLTQRIGFEEEAAEFRRSNNF
jgi:DNA-binding protein